jgi:hypothetical protein
VIVLAWQGARVVSPTPDPLTELTDPTDATGQGELAEQRNLVRRLEASMAAEHGADTPAYWRAMSNQLETYLAQPRFAAEAGQDEPTDRAHAWLTRVASAYRALAASS